MGSGCSNHKVLTLSADLPSKDGYRDGIGIGKEATIQVGFDQGYNGKGAPIGQQYGRLMGTVSAMEQYIGRRGMGMDKLGEEVASLKVTVKALQVKDLVEPDWEALEHERQHGGDASHFTRETQEEKGKRESTLRDLQARVDDLARLLFQTQAG